MLESFFNRIYRENLAVDEIIKAVQPELDLLTEKVQRIFNDAFPSTATLEGVLLWETLLGILADPSSETLSFRRRRVIGRLASNTPYTERMLHQVMDGIIGVDGWSYELDHRNYSLDITSLRPGRKWMEEMTVLLKTILPANLLFHLYITYNTHMKLSEFTHDYLSQFTHEESREEDLDSAGIYT